AAADDRGIAAELSDPEPLADQRDRLRAWTIVVIGQRTAAQRRHSKGRKETGGHACRRQPFGLTAPDRADSRGGNLVAADVRERSLMAAVEQERCVAL